MTVADTASAAQTDAPARADDAYDWARPLLDRQLWILGQLAEGGLEIARAIERAATDKGADDAVRAAAPMAYARVARAVRMTIMLQSKLIADFQKLRSEAAQAAAHANCLRGTQRVGLAHAQKRRIGRIVGRIAWAEGRPVGEVERLARHAAELLDHDDHYGDMLSRPISELIALICQDLGLAPDWPQLAEEAWAKAEIAGGAAGAPLAAAVARAADAQWPTAAAEATRFTPHAASP
jgi:hypothetical protein